MMACNCGKKNVRGYSYYSQQRRQSTARDGAQGVLNAGRSRGEGRKKQKKTNE